MLILLSTKSCFKDSTYTYIYLTHSEKKIEELLCYLSVFVHKDIKGRVTLGPDWYFIFKCKVGIVSYLHGEIFMCRKCLEYVLVQSNIYGFGC